MSRLVGRFGDRVTWEASRTFRTPVAALDVMRHASALATELAADLAKGYRQARAIGCVAENASVTVTGESITITVEAVVTDPVD